MWSNSDTVTRPAPAAAYAAAAASAETQQTATSGAHITCALTDAELAWGADWLIAHAQAA